MLRKGFESKQISIQSKVKFGVHEAIRLQYVFSIH